jgi:hypothetical protein
MRHLPPNVQKKRQGGRVVPTLTVIPTRTRLPLEAHPQRQGGCRGTSPKPVNDHPLGKYGSNLRAMKVMITVIDVVDLVLRLANILSLLTLIVTISEATEEGGNSGV